MEFHGPIKVESLSISDMQSMASLGRTLVFFDLKTVIDDYGSDPREGDIIQLAAISGDHTFNVYMMPQDGIDDTAGFSEEDGQLFHNNKAVSTVTLHKALTSFIAFLRSFNLPILLAAHKAQDFAIPVLNRALLRCCLAEQFQQLGSRLLDTLPLSKALCPGLDSYEQNKLSYPFLGKTDNGHNALKDVTALQELYGIWNPNLESVAQYLF